ncbi:MAG: DUF5908 family protein [Synechococcales bacterium]|nr:DUF5908 family protein [Synechococcales bacterium]
MPLEIRELVIKAIAAGGESSLVDQLGGDRPISEADQAAIIAACIDQVLTILQTKSER